MFSPEEIKETDLSMIDVHISNLDSEFRQNHGNYDWEDAILEYELPVTTRNEIANRYISVGWKYVYHRTSSENGEMPGLTHFILSATPITCFKNMYCVSNRKEDGMEIVRNNTRNVEFGVLKAGDVFDFAGTLYMKIEKEPRTPEKLSYGACNLNTGEMENFGDLSVVKIVHGKFVEEPEELV